MTNAYHWYCLHHTCALHNLPEPKTFLIYSFSLTTLVFVGQSAETKLKLVVEVVVEGKRENELQLIITDKKTSFPTAMHRMLKKKTTTTNKVIY